MKIAGEEARYVSRILESALQYGARYVCLDRGIYDEPLQIETMHFFTGKTEAQEYSYVKRTTENEYLTTLPVLPLQEQLQKGIELQKIVRYPKDIRIDALHLLSQERVQKQIFIEQIFNQLYERKIKPDMRRLIDGIESDEMKFTINGAVRGYGGEKPCMIQIEQNDSRAYAITAIDIQNNYQIKYQTYMKSAVLEESVQKEDALEIKTVLQEEKERGRRFVSFPAGKEGLNKGDFVPFKSALDAGEYAYGNDGDKYIVRSIPVVEKEINHLLENNRDQQQGKPTENQRDDKRSPGQELSR